MRRRAGASAVVRFVAQVIADTGADVGIDWHGHRDRDLAIINSIAALEAGATRVHGAALGIGERVGNTPMDLLLVNLVLMGFIDARPAAADGVLRDGVRGVRRADSRQLSGGRPRRVPHRHRRARGGGVKAWKKGDRDLMDAVYSAIPASLVGREQEIDVGPMSGKSNVVFWLEKRGIPRTDADRRSRLREGEGVDDGADRRRNSRGSVP